VDRVSSPESATRSSTQKVSDDTQGPSPVQAQPHESESAAGSHASNTQTSSLSGSGTHTASPTGTPKGQSEDDMERLRKELVNTPAEAVIANHVYGLFELAAIYLSEKPPRLPQAQLAIDALGALVNGVKGRLGDSEQAIDDALSQIRIAFVQIGKAQQTNDGA